MKNLYIALSILMVVSCEQRKERMFNEQYRPQYHFTPPSNWMNDPNGMVYYEGEYHLFYQHYPDSNVWGPMHWGHAVSADLLHWEHLPIALYPDSLGWIFSGSCVIDWNNTSGLGSKENPPMVAIFTYHSDPILQSGRLDFQYQGMAYSLDKGRTWTKYENNPVLPNQGIIDFRDPKVIWYEAGQKWIMALAVWDHVSFYSSKDLKSWEFESDFGVNWGSHAGVWECPDFFPMTVENSDDQKWVLLSSINPGGPQGGSATQYFVGDFDGKEFKLDSAFAAELEVIPAYEPEGEVFDDFETGYGKWKTNGLAFGEAPANGSIGDQQEVSGFLGQGLVNSFNGGSDKDTGTLESVPFTISKPYVNMRLGGGNDSQRTYVALVVDGKEVRNASGRNGEKMDLRSWDVSEFIGKEAFIRAVDNHTSVWGHVNLDQIVFSDEPARPKTEKALWVDYGADNYAGVTWSDVPVSDGRRLFLGWMSNWQYAQVTPTKAWRSAMTLPRALKLVKTNETYRLKSEVTQEIDLLLGEGSKLKLRMEEELIGEGVLVELNGLGSQGELQFSNDNGDVFKISFTETGLIIDRSNSGITDFHADFGNVHSVNFDQVKPENLKVFLDRSSIEVFVNEGELVLTELVFPTHSYSKIMISGCKSAKQSLVKSIWD